MNTKECRSRIVDEFIELTQIDAVSYRERKIADVLKEKLLLLMEAVPGIYMDF